MRMPDKFELTWVAKLKQWRKRRKVNGKPRDFYLGSGKGKFDRASYAKALSKWRQIEGDLKRREQAQKAGHEYDAWRDFLASRPGVEPEAYYGSRKPQQPLPEKVSPSMQRWMEGTARVGEDRLGKPQASRAADKPIETMASQIDAYIEHQQRRYKHGLRFPNAPRKERISAGRCMTYQINAMMIKAAWGEELLPHDEASVSKLMNGFRDQQQQLMLDGKIAPGTFNERIKTLRHVAHWLFKKFTIPCLPRDKDELFAMYSVQPSARALSLEVIHRLWAASPPRFRLYMLLGLNTGLYVSDIAHLEYDHIKNGYLVCNRHKTGVPIRIKLWHATKRLLASECNGTGRFLFQSRKGGSLLIVDPFAGKTGRRWCEIDSNLAAIKARLEIKPLSFSMFRDTSSTKIESIDRTVTDMFDGHADRRMARFYVDRSSLDQDRMFAALDMATTELESYYGLKLE